MKKLVVLLLVVTSVGAGVLRAVARPSAKNQDDARNILSPAYRACFGPDAPLDAESYPCLDTEYHRLEAQLNQEYRSALNRQSNDAARKKLDQDERQWLRVRFRSCDKDAAEFNGATATVIHESCAIDALAKRILKLRRYGG